MNVALAPQTTLTLCCAAPLWRGLRCTGCGHRQEVNSVPPVQTRDLMLRRPLAAPLIAVTELLDRAQAKRSTGGAA